MFVPMLLLMLRLVPAEGAQQASLDIEDVKEMLRATDQIGGEQKKLLSLGEKAFPIYLRILSSKVSEPLEVSRVFVVVAAVKGDRSQFLEPAIASLSHSDDSVRRNAATLIALIGSPRDSAPLVALLSDKEWTVSVAAVKAIAAIGDHRSLQAIDCWLNGSIPTGSDRPEKELRKHVTKHRDELHLRLEKEKLEGERPRKK